jgi:hypothetical protein
MSTPNELMAASACFQCLDATQAGAVAVYTAVATANGGTPPLPGGFVFGEPDVEFIFGNPDTGDMFGEE